MSNATDNGKGSTARKARVMQTDVPSLSLEQALRVPRAIADNYAAQPTTPLNLAAALEMQPSSGPFRMLCGASIAYGLTVGGYNASQIELTSVARRIVRPTEEGDDLAARREAVLQPKIVREFLRRYDNSPLPKEAIAINVLEELGVPRSRAPEVLSMIVESAETVGFVRTIKDRKYIDVSTTALDIDAVIDAELPAAIVAENGSEPRTLDVKDARSDDGEGDAGARKKRVFLTHGRNKDFLAPISKLLSFGELEGVVSAERQTVSKPVPDKVMADMRSCGAAIIHVDAEQVVIDRDANEHIILNENVLIEIGAAMALYGKRFVLLVRDGVRLPSNLQGLYEVRYAGDALDGAATIKLLEAINDIKNYPLPPEIA